MGKEQHLLQIVPYIRLEHLQHWPVLQATTNPHGQTKSTCSRLEIYLDRPWDFQGL